MLPEFSVQISDIAEIGFNQSTGGNSPVGDAFWFSWEPVLSAAKKQGVNFDTYLTHRIGKFLNDKKTKTTLVIFYAPFNDRFCLTICSRNIPDFFKVLHSNSGMPGYLSYGEDYVTLNAKPFIYYMGLQVFRVYQAESPKNNTYYVSDFGNAFGLTTSPCDKETYSDINDHPVTYMDYSVVPNEPTTQITIDSKNVTVNHAFINI